MRKATRYARTSALPAIAAALALSSTHAITQETPAQPPPTTPSTSEPAPTVSAQPAPTLDAAPLGTDTSVVTQDSSTAAAKPKRTVTTASTTARRSAPVATHAVAQKTTTRTTTHAAAPAVAAPVAAAAGPAAPVNGQPAMKPIVDMSTAPAKPTQSAARATSKPNETAIELGGGALALLAIGAGAWALTRRRREREEAMGETYEAEPEMAPRHDPIFDEQPAIVAPEPSAFAWGNAHAPAESSDDGSDRRPGETWVERAYRGPSPANPSVSLRARLKRAAFFDKREREVAAGKAEPVDTDAGLPEAMVEEQATESEREFA